MERHALASLSAVADQYLHWFGQWHRAALFPAEFTEGITLKPPLALDQTPGFQQLSQYRHLPVFARLRELHEMLNGHAAELERQARAGKVIDYEIFNSAWVSFEALTSQLRRVEHTLQALEGGILDRLTGLKIPTHLVSIIEKELKQYETTGTGFIVALADINHLETINRNHSRDAGDFVLTETAGRIGHNLRPHDDVYRLQEDKFLIILKRITPENGLSALQRLQRRIAVLPVSLPDGRDIAVTASFGAVAPEPGITADKVLDHVRIALSHAKKQGGQVTIYPSDPIKAD